MSVTFNASTTSGLQISSDTSGVIQFQSNGNNIANISSTGVISANAVSINGGTIISTVTNMAANPVTGTPSSSNYLRGDGTWASVSGLGVGQTWTNVTASRALGTTYTNSTSNPIFASVYVTGQTTIGVTITVNGNIVATFQWGGTQNHTSTIIIPAGATYSFSTGSGSLGTWWELR